MPDGGSPVVGWQPMWRRGWGGWPSRRRRGGPGGDSGPVCHWRSRSAASPKTSSHKPKWAEAAVQALTHVALRGGLRIRRSG